MTTPAINKAAVIGAGVMGSGIAAHLANAGIAVVLLDIPSSNGGGRSAIAEQALAKLRKADPAAFMHAKAASRVATGNIEDDLGLLAECDWIIEAVVEKREIKQDLYRKIDSVRKAGSVVSSNTSTLPLATLIDGIDATFAGDFMITHFFNPPRYMRLLEIVAGTATRADAVAMVSDFADRQLGKGVVMCHDTPGFIANRIGTFWLQSAVIEAFDRGLRVEEADAVMGRPIGVPKTGVFGLIDLVGLDLMPHVDRNMAESLPADDAYHGVRRDIPLINNMIAEGSTGRKGKGGFYRLNTDGGKRVKEAIDLTDGSYATAQRRVALASVDGARKGGPLALVMHDDKGGQYAWAVLSATLAYTASLVPEIADDIVAVDRAMRLGYNWTYGPFELIDRIGAKAIVERLTVEQRDVPALLQHAADGDGFYRVVEGKREYLTTSGGYAPVTQPAGTLSLADIKLAGERIAGNGSASLWDIGDGAVCLEVHTKMNSIDQDVLAMIGKAVKIVEKDHAALVIYNDGAQFSAGANLGLGLFAANTGLWPMIEELVSQGQKAYLALKYAPFPVVSAPSGLALGGGCEMLLHSDAVQAHAESYIGLVEAGVGIVPAWGGCKEMLTRFANAPGAPGGPVPPMAKTFETIGMAQVAKSAFEARDLGYLRATDGITFNRDRLLADAKARALELVAGYAPPEPPTVTLAGPSGKAALGLALHDLTLKGVATPHDQVVAGELAVVLSGGDTADITAPVGEDTLMALERDAFMRLIRTEATLMRMEHTLTTGKPLRN